MEYSPNEARDIDVSKIFLHEENPRFDPIVGQSNIIEYLCNKERVVQLAVDIANNGLNPLEILALLKGENGTFVVVEGNRRICAIKLLNDPALAPAKFRRKFQKQSAGWQNITKVRAIVFNNLDDVKLWLSRIHAGEAGGKGRRTWGSEAVTRNSPETSRSKNGLYLLDHAETIGLIVREQRERCLSIVDRYISNPMFRNSLGVSFAQDGSLKVDIDEEFYKSRLKKFIDDVISREITTRDNKPVIDQYAEKLGKVFVSADEDSEFGSPSPNDIKEGYNATPPNVKKIVQLPEIRNILSEMQSYKLLSLYHSICSITLKNHAAIISVGIWSFIETLISIHNESVSGNKSIKTSIIAFFSKEKKKKLLPESSAEELKAITEALGRLANGGNTTKHDAISAIVDGQQLALDWKRVEKLLAAQMREILAAK